MKIRDEVIAELKELLAHLENNNIEYILSGSLALNAHMIPRFTRDVDIVIDLPQNKLDVFCKHFTDKFYLNKNTVKTEVEKKGFFNALSNATGYKYDFIVQRNAAFEKIKFERKQRLIVFDIEAWVISAEDLILSKLEWMQESESFMQKNDIIALKEEALIDMQYILLWIKKLGLKTFGLF